MADGVFAVDPDLRITYWKLAAEEITVYPAGESPGRQCREVFRPSLCAEESPMRQAIATGRAAGPREVGILTRDSLEATVSVSAAALEDRDGSVLGGTASLRSVRGRCPAQDPGQRCVEVAGVVSRSRAMRRVLRILPALARSDASVLIRGPSGAAKELIARAIHRLSRRNAHVFLKLRSAALGDGLGGEELRDRRGERGSGLPAWVDEVAPEVGRVAGEGAPRAADGEREVLIAALRKHGGNRTLAAMDLGVHRSTLWRHMRKFGLAEEPHPAGGEEIRSAQPKRKERS